MSGPDIDTPRFEVVQIAAWRDGSAALRDRLSDAGWELPPFGAAWCDDDRVACSVRPTRWLLIAPAPASGMTEPTLAERCETLIGDAGAVTDLSAARCAWRISEMLQGAASFQQEATPTSGWWICSRVRPMA